MFISIEKTPQEKAKEQVIAFTKESQLVVDSYKYGYQKLHGMVFGGKSREEVQAFFDVLGTEAYKVFETAQKVVTHITELDPTYTPPSAPYNYTINQDGTVTVGELIVSEPTE